MGKRLANSTAVLFDFDGVVSDTEPHGLRRTMRICSLMGCDLTYEELMPVVGTSWETEIPLIGSLFEGHGRAFDPSRFDELDQETPSIYTTAPLVPSPGVRELIEGLRARGVLVGLISNTDSRLILHGLNRMRMTALFDAIVCYDMVSHGKPDPEGYRMCMERLGVTPEECVTFEDSPSGIAAAKAAGIYIIGYRGTSIVQDTSAADETIQTFEGLLV